MTNPLSTSPNSIVANGVSGGVEADNCTFSGGGTLNLALGYNLIDDTTCGTPGTGDIIGKNPQLGALGGNGGPTRPSCPPSASPAVGRGAGGGVQRQRREHRPARGRPGRSRRQRGLHHRIGRGGPGPELQPQRLPPGGRRGRDLRLRAQLQRLAGHVPPQRAHRGHCQLAGAQRLPHGGRRRRGLRPRGANFYGSLGGQTLPSPIVGHRGHTS